MDLQRVGAVLEFVGHRDRGARQLAGLAHQSDARSDALGDGTGEEESAGLDADHDVDLILEEGSGHLVDGLEEGTGVRQQWRDVLEDDPGLGEVRHVGDESVEVDHGAHTSPPRNRARAPSRWHRIGLLTSSPVPP